jgi:hypothetical protein
MLLAANGVAVIFEANVLSDITTHVTFDLARSIDVMLEVNSALAAPLSLRKPQRTFLVLWTPALTQPGRAGDATSKSRLYGWLMPAYQDPDSSLLRQHAGPVPLQGKYEQEGMRDDHGGTQPASGREPPGAGERGDRRPGILTRLAAPRTAARIQGQGSSSGAPARELAAGYAAATGFLISRPSTPPESNRAGDLRRGMSNAYRNGRYGRHAWRLPLKVLERRFGVSAGGLPYYIP